MKRNDDVESLDINRLANEIPEKEYDPSREHPTPEQLLLRMALDSLSPKQKKIWDMYAYGFMTQEEIGKILKMTQPAVALTIERIEEKVKKFVNQNRGAYALLKIDYKIMNEGTDNE